MNQKSELQNNHTVTRYTSIKDIEWKWSDLVKEPFQTSEFLYHLERTNPCNQRYYILSDKSNVLAGAVVYTLNVNLFTFSKFSTHLKMTVLGIPASVDSSGIIGNEEVFPNLVSEILKSENGIILALNFEKKIDLPNIIMMNTLPSFIFHHSFESFDAYINQMRHHYRRRILKSMKLFQEVETVKSTCQHFTYTHYELYLNIMKRTRTKLEILSFRFFNELPDTYILTDYRDNNGTILSWHITHEYKGIYAFLFGGINYEYRDYYNSYFNNLIGIYKEGIEKKCPIINLGQTAAQPKSVLGAKKVEKLMFVYHKKSLIRLFFKLFKKYLTYKDQTINYTIFK